MTRYTFFNYTGCFWKHYTELTMINKIDKRYEKCLECNIENGKKCIKFTSIEKLEHIIDEIRERTFKK